MPIGPGTFVPQGQFACPRSYWRGVVFNLTPDYIVIPLLGTYHWVYVPDPNIVFTVIFDSRFHAWSSNRWTLDHMVTDFYLTIAPDPTAIPQPYSVRWKIRPSNLSSYVEIRFNDLDLGTLDYFELPAAPSGYWLPPDFP